MIVFCDDLSLSFGEVKFKASGSSGGHNGLKSIISALGSQKFSRVKLGIKNETCEILDASSFVLGKFSDSEEKQIPDILERATTIFLQNFDDH